MNCIPPSPSIPPGSTSHPPPQHPSALATRDSSSIAIQNRDNTSPADAPRVIHNPNYSSSDATPLHQLQRSAPTATATDTNTANSAIQRISSDPRASSTPVIHTSIPNPAPTVAPRPSAIIPSIPIPSTPTAPMPSRSDDLIGPRADSWTYTEAMAATSLVIYVFLELPYAATGTLHEVGRPRAGSRIKLEDKFRLVSELLEGEYGIRKGWSSVKSWWCREGRGVTGLDERERRAERFGEQARRTERKEAGEGA